MLDRPCGLSVNIVTYSKDCEMNEFVPLSITKKHWHSNDSLPIALWFQLEHVFGIVFMYQPKPVKKMSLSDKQTTINCKSGCLVQSNKEREFLISIKWRSIAFH